MGLFARFACLRREGTVNDLAQIIRDLLRARNVVETADLASAERLLMVAPAGDGWLMVFDHVEAPSASLDDADDLLAELSCTAGTLALDIVIADSDDLILTLMDGGAPQAQLAIGHGGLESGALEPWQPLLLPGQSIDDLRKAFAKGTTLVEENLPALKPTFGIDLAAFDEVGKVPGRQSTGAGVVLLHLKTVPAPGQSVDPPTLEVDDNQRQNIIRNRSFPQIPRGLVTHFAFGFKSRGGGARGLEVRLAGSALEEGLIEIVSARLKQRHPTDPKLNKDIEVAPEPAPKSTLLRFDELKVPDWVQPNARTIVRARASLHDLQVFVYCRALKVGDAELEAEARLVTPRSATVQTSYPVTVLPEMWLPLKGSERPAMVQAVRALNDPARINGLAVLRGGVDAAVAALRRTLETWRSLIGPTHTFQVAAATDEAVSAVVRRTLKTLRSLAGPAHMPTATERANEAFFFWPADLMMPFKLDLNKKRQAKWDRLMADLPSVHGLRIISGDLGHGFSRDSRGYAERIVLHYTSPAKHPRLLEYAARLGHLSLSAPASPAAELALVSLMRDLAAEGLVCQAYVGTWDNDDEPKGTLYERAADIHMHEKAARGWSARYLRAVADRLWLGPEFTAMVPDRAALERVAVVSQIGNALAIERRPEATLRDIELCLEPMLASQADSQAFTGRLKSGRPQSQ